MLTLPIIEKLGIQMDPQLFSLAFVHRSWAYENGGVPTNERLEFLGDSVLGVVVTEHLYRTYPDLPEGQLAPLRAAVVNTRSLADVGRALQLGPLIKLGRGEIRTGGYDKDSILADTVESIIGATFLSGGMPAAEKLVHELMDPLVAAAASDDAGRDFKTAMQDICAHQSWPMPTYDFEATGPDHDRVFQAWCVVDGHRYGPGKGKSKKRAEQLSAGIAFKELKHLLS
ncbi:MAG: ribonuclease III [Propionibacteriaceae bacterium]